MNMENGIPREPRAGHPKRRDPEQHWGSPDVDIPGEPHVNAFLHIAGPENQRSSKTWLLQAQGSLTYLFKLQPDGRGKVA